MAKLEEMKEFMFNAGSEKRFVDGFENGAVWTYKELANFLKTYLWTGEYTYIDANCVSNFLFDFRNHLTNKNIK